MLSDIPWTRTVLPIATSFSVDQAVPPVQEIILATVQSIYIGSVHNFSSLKGRRGSNGCSLVNVHLAFHGILLWHAWDFSVLKQLHSLSLLLKHSLHSNIFFQLQAILKKETSLY